MSSTLSGGYEPVSRKSNGQARTHYPRATVSKRYHRWKGVRTRVALSKPANVCPTRNDNSSVANAKSLASGIIARKETAKRVNQTRGFQSEETHK